MIKRKSVVNSVKWRLSKLEPVEGWYQKTKPFKGYKKIDEQIKRIFIDRSSNNNFSRYSSLIHYFFLGFIKYRSKNGARVYYPGAGGFVGRHIDGLEGFARILPLISAWIFAGNKTKLVVYGESIDLVELIFEGIISGTDPTNAEYWGNIKDRDQRVVEAADIALSLWLSKDLLWTKFSSEQKQQIADWLIQVNNVDVYSGVAANWELFPIITLMSLKGLDILGEEYDLLIKDRFHHYKRNYLGEGWFYDTADGADYYNAWAIHYTLFWLNQIDPEFESDFIISCQSSFVSFYKHLFSRYGFPLMGRSVCYRLATPSPLLTASLMAPEVVSPGLAFRALDEVYRYFVDKGTLKFGTLTQGFCCTNLSVLDKYSGPGSCLWSLRSLITCLYVSKFTNIWETPLEKLPIEKGDFWVECPTIGWAIEGESSKHCINLYISRNKTSFGQKLIEYGYKNRVAEFIFRRPFRPNNYEALYCQPIYSTKNPIVKC